jgi:histidine triad (HIT) family protein
MFFSFEVVSMDCIFCKIARGEIPCERIFEDKDVIAFLSISPVNKGHVLVVPKKHVVNLLDMDEGTARSLFSHVRKLCKPVLAATNAEGLNVSMNNNPASGQEVMHAHVHIIPRYHDDGHRAWMHTTYTGGEFKQYGEKIRDVLRKEEGK